MTGAGCRCGETRVEAFNLNWSAKTCRACLKAWRARHYVESVKPLNEPMCDERRGGCGIKHHSVVDGVCGFCRREADGVRFHRATPWPSSWSPLWEATES